MAVYYRHHRYHRRSVVLPSHRHTAPAPSRRRQDAAKRSSVDGTRTVAAKRRQVVRGGIALMALEAVTGIIRGVGYHPLVPCCLCDDRRGLNLRKQTVAPHDSTSRERDAGRVEPSVHDDFLNLEVLSGVTRNEIVPRASHRQQRRVMDIHPVDFLRPYPTDADPGTTVDEDCPLACPLMPGE